MHQLIKDTVCCKKQCQNPPEGLSHWAHTQHYVKVVLDSLHQVAEQVEVSTTLPFLAVSDRALYTYRWTDNS